MHGMTPTRAAAFAALAGGTLWLVRAFAIWGQATASGGVPGAALWTGYVAFALALAASGYSLVATAPVWLRALVSVALPALVAAVWAALAEGLASDWLTSLLGALVGLGWAVLALRHTRPAPPAVRGRRSAPPPGHRSASAPGRRVAQPVGRRASR